jgi:signal transduction histidine kinase
VVVEVADTGIGIPAAEQDALFSRFFRASNATALAIPGTGLGLMIVRTVVELHGGELQVRSVEGEGTTVSVRLPVVAATAAAARPQGVGAP